MAGLQKKLTACCKHSIGLETASATTAVLTLSLLSLGCHETQELFAAPDASQGSRAVFHLISIGANAQTDGLGEVNGLGAAIILHNELLLFWGNGGEETDGRGIVVVVVDPKSGSPIGAPQNFDTWETRRTGATETMRLVAFLEARPASRYASGRQS
jgi:hypothetical protein